MNHISLAIFRWKKISRRYWNRRKWNNSIYNNFFSISNNVNCIGYYLKKMLWIHITCKNIRVRIRWKSVKILWFISDFNTDFFTWVCSQTKCFYIYYLTLTLKNAYLIYLNLLNITSLLFIGKNSEDNLITLIFKSLD